MALVPAYCLPRSAAGLGMGLPRITTRAIDRRATALPNTNQVYSSALVKG